MYSYPTRLSARCRKLLLCLNGRLSTHVATVQGDAVRRSGTALQVYRPQHDDVVWIDPYALAAAGFNQPGELHDRATRSIKDQLLDVAGISLDLIALSTDDGYLCRGCHRPCELSARVEARLEAIRACRVVLGKHADA
jgi:hypothetical protein